MFAQFFLTCICGHVFHRWRKHIRTERVNTKSDFNIIIQDICSGAIGTNWSFLPVPLTSCCSSTITTSLPLVEERALCPSLCHLHLLPPIISLTSLLNHPFPQYHPFLTSLICHVCLLKLPFSLTPSCTISSVSLISYLKQGRERLGDAMASRLAPPWPVFGLANDLYKG